MPLLEALNGYRLKLPCEAEQEQEEDEGGEEEEEDTPPTGEEGEEGGAEVPNGVMSMTSEAATVE